SSRAVSGHVAQRSQNSLHQNPLPCRAHAFQVGPDAAAGRGDLFIGSALDTLLKIHQPRADKNRMGVGIHEPGQDNFTGAVDLSNFLAIPLQPGIAEGVFGGADRNDLPAETEDRTVFDDADFSEVGATTRTSLAGK